jgi:hypothetical protein
MYLSLEELSCDATTPQQWAIQPKTKNDVSKITEDKQL